MAFSRIRSAQTVGLATQAVTVETDVNRGLYLFQIVGMADKAVEESRERVISAIRHTFDFNIKGEGEKIVVSLSPAELKKEGAYFDLAIAIGYLIATERLTLPEEFQNALFLGELALNGDVRPIRGLLSIAQWAKTKGITTLFIPEANASEAALVDGLTFYLVPTLDSLVSFLRPTIDAETGERVAQSLPVSEYTGRKNSFAGAPFDFADIRGQALAKRALTIAAAGGHNIVLYGPPGTGKTMLAKAFHSILPTLDENEFLEVATIYSSIGLIDDALEVHVPIRSPHHSASHVAIIGGGQTVRPGDISLAHRGVLYMDEFPEFDRRVIEALREPLEEGHITVARAKGSARFPARFILLAAMNPCPCGYRGSTIKVCSCSGMELMRYKKKLSGPIVDRIDLWVPVEHIDYETLHESSEAKESPAIRKQVADVRTTALKRSHKLNAELSTNEVNTLASLAPAAKKTLQYSAEKLKLSPRSYIRAIKVARTIADLENSIAIEEPHILEALQFRPKLDY
jgi:magnesium chelatase family protein